MSKAEKKRKLPFDARRRGDRHKSDGELAPLFSIAPVTKESRIRGAGAQPQEAGFKEKAHQTPNPLRIEDTSSFDRK